MLGVANQPSPAYAIKSGYPYDQFDRLQTDGRFSTQYSVPVSKISRSSTAAKHVTTGSDMPNTMTTPAKSRRVRTGCLTCRERHLKCDESTPDCLNCRKSNRKCKRGVRLNFIDMTCKEPPYIPRTGEWSGKNRLVANVYSAALIVMQFNFRTNLGLLPRNIEGVSVDMPSWKVMLLHHLEKQTRI